MNSPKYFIFKEHGYQDNHEAGLLKNKIRNNVELFNASHKEPNSKYLGLNSNFQAYYYIGMRWVQYEDQGELKNGVIWVKPKEPGISYEALLYSCLMDPIVSRYLDNCYGVYPEEPSIIIPNDYLDFLTPLLISDFLRKVQIIVKKGLKKEFVPTTELLNNKIKGKILIKKTLRQQLKAKTLTKTVCSYQHHTIDCLENQIIKAALLQVKKYIFKYQKDKWILKKLVNYNLAAFQQVSTVSIKPTDFSAITFNVFYKGYKKAIELSRFILKSFGFSINSDIEKGFQTVPPFYINMPELFERYCEVLLRSKFSDTKAGYERTGYSETRASIHKLRPDFIIPSQNLIIESKYKYWIESANDIEGIKQLSLYARNNKVLELLNNNEKKPDLLFLYPDHNGYKIIDLEYLSSYKDFNRIFRYPIKVNY